MKYLPHYHNCFVCGDTERGKLGVRFRMHGDEVVAEYTPTEVHTGYRDRIHGGLLCTLLDETMGWAPSIHGHRLCYSVELNIRFLKPVPAGTRLIITGRSIRAEGRLWLAEGEITDGAGTVYARGKGKYMPMSEEDTRNCLAYLDADENTMHLDW